ALSQALARIGPLGPAPAATSPNGLGGRQPGPTNGIAGSVGASRLTPTNPGPPVPPVPRSAPVGVAAPGRDRARTDRLPPVPAVPPGSTYPGYQSPTSSGAAPRRRRRRPRLGVGIVVACLALTALILVGVLLVESQGPGNAAPGATGTGGSGTPIQIHNVTVFMANDRPPDNPRQTRLTFDGNPSTAWMTAHYRSPTFGNLYPGIGLAIDLGSSHTLHRLSVTSATHGWAAQAYTSATTIDSGQPVTAWGSPSATQTDIAGNASFDLGGRHGRYVLLWLTYLGPSDVASVNELSIS
ncbi:MAG: hypothetical protein J2P57_07050, partial [Acidimicrobiaceae bacterium]|nr:hypothetical protein [Acidimicrobiaceae bacterium]